MITYQDLAELTSALAPFNCPGWIFELKYDGFRMLAASRDGTPELMSRRGNDFADRFPEISFELLRLPDAMLDGELVILDPEGRPQFERLSRRSRLSKPISITHGSRTEPACLFVFDCCSSPATTYAPVRSSSAALLKQIVSGSKWIRYVDDVDDGVALFEVADKIELEGIVGKRADAPYPRGGKSKDWIKNKTAHGRLVDVERAKWNER